MSEPMLENLLYIIHVFFVLRAPRNWVVHTSACLLLPRLGWLEGVMFWEEKGHPKAPRSPLRHSRSRQKFCISMLGCAVVCMEQYQDHGYL